MTISLPADLEAAVVAEAQRLGMTPESFVIQVLRERLGLATSPRPLPFEPRDQWERDLLAMASPCGVALSDEALYD